MLTKSQVILCEIAELAQVAVEKGGDVVLQIQTPDGVFHNYAFSPSQIRGIAADIEKALNFHGRTDAAPKTDGDGAD